MTEAKIVAGAGGSKTWALKTPDEIVADVAALASAVTSPTDGVEMPDTLLVPQDQFDLIHSVRMTDGDSTTIAKFILANNPYIKMIEAVSGLKGLGDGGTDRALVYTRDVDKLGLQIPQPFEQLDADKKGMEYEIPCHSECAGVVMYYPLSAAYGDGI